MALDVVFLVGYMASGKSTVGEELARRLGWDFIDLDSRIETQEGKSVPQIFRDGGEAAFRLAEERALRNLLVNTPQNELVVALGGGAFVQEQNRALLQSWPTVFLEASLAELWRRSQVDGIERPLRRDLDQFARLYEARLPFYRLAKVTIQTGGKPLASICDEIEEALQLDPHHRKE